MNTLRKCVRGFYIGVGSVLSIYGDFGRVQPKKPRYIVKLGRYSISRQFDKVGIYLHSAIDKASNGRAKGFTGIKT